MAKKKTQLSKAAQQRVKNYEAKGNIVDARKGVKRSDNKVAVVAGIVALAIAFASQIGYSALHPSATPSPSASASASPAPSAAATNSSLVPAPALSEYRTWTGTITVNSQPVSITLDGKNAPQAVANFVTLAKKGFYNNTKCHRLTTSGLYVLQCGDPLGTGMGGPGYTFGPIENAPSDSVYRTGVIAMANSGGQNTMGSQFFIVYKDSPLGGAYSVFGKVTNGLSVINKIAATGTADGKTDGAPKNPVVINAISVK
jgi:peptidyl-prolyl cis-trans isomerase B (cyclophilin B)